MTGRDLIVYILQNHLEDEEVFKDGKFIGFLTAKEAAVKFGVSKPTIFAWLTLGMLEGDVVNTQTCIPATAEVNPEKLKQEVK